MSPLDAAMPVPAPDRPVDWSRLHALFTATSRRKCVACGEEFDAVGLTAYCDPCGMLPAEAPRPAVRTPDASWPRRHLERIATMTGPAYERAVKLAPKIVGAKLCVLAGNRGMGKTQIATYVAWWRGQHGHGPGLYSRAFDMVQDVIGYDRDVKLARYQNAEFLTLDEVHRSRPADMPLLESVVDDRYSNNRATILIGNWLTIEGIHKGQEIDGEQCNGIGSSLFHRLQEHQRDKSGGVVWCNWQSYRSERKEETA